MIALRLGVPVLGAAVLFAAAWLIRRPEPQPVVAKTDDDVDFICVEPTAESNKDRVEAARLRYEMDHAPNPSAQVYARLGECLREMKARGLKVHSVADIRYWVEVEHAPVWLDFGVWWFPLSLSPDPEVPAGTYVKLPADGSECSTAVVD